MAPVSCPHGPGTMHILLRRGVELCHSSNFLLSRTSLAAGPRSEGAKHKSAHQAGQRGGGSHPQFLLIPAVDVAEAAGRARD